LDANFLHDFIDVVRCGGVGHRARLLRRPAA
jgi:hypothetical protein